MDSPNRGPSPSEQPAGGLSHVSPDGKSSRMVDVGGKAVSARRALASARVRFPPGVLGRLLRGEGPKGPILEVARVAGILAAKRTGDLIPMCHPLGLDHVEIHFEEIDDEVLEVRAEAACRGKTGVEMEALTACSLAALTLYDMSKAVAKGIVIERVALLEKDGGKGGPWRRGVDR